jgi:hypothetical protein
MCISLVLAAAGFAHASVGLAASNLALAALAVPAHFLNRLPRPAAAATKDEKKKKNKNDKEGKDNNEAGVKEVGPVQAAAACLAIVPFCAPAPAAVGVEEEVEEIEAFFDADPPPATAADAAMAIGADAVFAAAIGAGATPASADAAVEHFVALLDSGCGLQDAVALATRRALAAQAEAAARDGGIVATASGGAAALGCHASSFLAWATADPQNWAVVCLGAKAAAIVSVVAVGALVISGVAVGALGALAISRAVRGARAARAHALLCQRPRPTSAGLFLPPPHPSSCAGGVQRVWIADDAGGMPLQAMASPDALWSAVAGAWDTLCEGPAHAAEAWEDAWGMPGMFDDDYGHDFLPPPPPPPSAIALLHRNGNNDKRRRFVQ